ncbi:DNA-directed RNA polymerase subunit F [ANME-1 cluster archaeon ex4572_4]|nr:MAG: DNA-directed RNA polymerase subunit F [ANME-1 cluster archaeon ex4572_4]
MIVKEVLDEATLTLAEVKEILRPPEMRKRTVEGTAEGTVEGTAEETAEETAEGTAAGEGEELRYERRKATEHAARFAKLGAKESRTLVNELLRLGKTNEAVAVRVADLMPKSKNEVRAIYAKERFSLTEASIEKILDCVAKFE